MTISKMYLFGLLVIVAKITTMNAEVDCNEHPPHVHIHECCELSNVILEDFKDKCGSILEERDGNESSDFGPPHGHPHGPHGHGPHGHGHRRGPPHHHRHHHECFFSCVFNETGILIDGELVEDNVNLYLNELFDDSEYVELINNKLLYCNEKRNEFILNKPDHMHGPPSCDTKHGGMLIGCVSMEMFNDCPQSAWSDTDECNAVRDHFNQCSYKETEDDIEEEEI